MLLDRVRPVFEHPGPYLTIHAEIGKSLQNGHRRLDARWASMREDLGDRALPEVLVEDLERRLSESHQVPGEGRRTLVVAGEDLVLDELQPGHADWPETYDVGDLPDLAGWLRAAEAEIPFLLVQADRSGGELDLYSAARNRPGRHEDAEATRYYITKVPRGLRAQAGEAWRRDQGLLADEVASVARTRRPAVVLVAGDLGAVRLLEEGLSDVPAPLVHLEAAGQAAGPSEKALNEEIQQVLAAFEANRRLDLAERLEQAEGRSGRSATGVHAVLEALVRGQVGTLVMDPEAVASETVNPAEFAGLPLPRTASAAAVLPADRVLVAAATLCDAEVALLPAAVSPGEPVAALLRGSR